MEAQAQLSHSQVNAMFGAWVDHELVPAEEAVLRSHLEGCEPCQAQWNRYEETVSRVRNVERERLPRSLASTLVWRQRRQRPLFRRTAALHHQLRVPAELILIVLAAALAAVVVLGLLGR